MPVFDPQPCTYRFDSPGADNTVYVPLSTIPEGHQGLIQQNHVWPAPVLDEHNKPTDPWLPVSSPPEVWGYFDILMRRAKWTGGSGEVVGAVTVYQNVTYFNDVPTKITEMSYAEPFGDEKLTLRFETFNGYMSAVPGYIDDPFSEVWVFQRPSPAEPATAAWRGWVLAAEYGRGFVDVECVGMLYIADNLLELPPISPQEPMLVEEDIAAALQPYGRKMGFGWGDVSAAGINSGIMSRPGGRYEPVLTGYVQERLAKATTEAGAQLTVGVGDRQTPSIHWKDTTTVHWTVRFGTTGVECDGLKKDHSDVKTTAYIQGRAADGCYFRGARFPRLRLGGAPIFPGTVISPGMTVAGYGQFKQEAINNGFGLEDASDTYYVGEEGTIRYLQTALGITVDGDVGPQTWSTLFQPAASGYSLEDGYIHPGANITEAEPFLYSASGAIVGMNPAWDNQRWPRREVMFDFGGPVSFAEAARDAAAILNNQAQFAGLPDYFGELELSIDPEAGSRWDIRAGHNIMIKGFRGADRLFHIVHASLSPLTGKVTLTIDTKARDKLTLDQIRERNRDTVGIERKRAGWAGRSRSRTIQDEPALWDCEAGSGLIPLTGIYRGLWLVLKVPGARWGTVVESVIDVVSGGAYVPTRMAACVFNRPILASELQNAVGTAPEAEVGNPLYEGYWDNWDPMTSGIEIAWGGEGQAAGYYTGAEDEGDEPTGRLYEHGTWDFQSTQPPWLWVGIWVELPDPLSPVAYIQGRFKPGVEN